LISDLESSSWRTVELVESVTIKLQIIG